MRLRTRLSLAVAVWFIARSAFGATAEAWPAVDDADWKPFGESDGVAVFTRPFAGSAFAEVRASGTVCATLPELVAFVEDVARFDGWIPDTEEARLLARPSPREQLYYIRTSMPWPVKHRDMIYRLSESLSGPSADDVSVAIEGVPDYLPPYPGVVRMTRVTGRWTFREDAGRTHLKLDMHIEPGGSIPTMLANRRIVGTPTKMLVNLRQQFASSCHGEPGAAEK